MDRWADVVLIPTNRENPRTPMKPPTLHFLTPRLLLTLLLASLPAARADDAPAWENEAVFRVGKEAPHATKMPYPTVEAALAGKRMASPWCRLLNGDWKFHWVPRPEEHPRDFFKTDFDDSNWKTIPVPSCVELLGYGTPLYTNVTYPFKKDPPRVTGEPDDKTWTMFKERNAVSSYRHGFELPAEWRGRRTFITFNGVAAGFHLYLNGRHVGYSEDSRTPAEFDLSPHLKPGRNLLAVEVYRHTDGSYLEDQDMWRLSGIFRDVYLWSAAELDLRDFEVRGALAEDGRTGTLTVRTWTRNQSGRPAGYQLEADLTDTAGGSVARLVSSGTVPASGEHAAGAEKQGIPVRPWSAEDPALYQMLLTLRDEAGSVVAHYSCKVGFNRSEIKNGNLLVNGKPVLIKGVNRHDSTPRGGYHVTEAEMIADLDAMKRLNINTIRTSHYPNDPRFLELVDEYGFYAISEANIESHGMGYKEETLANVPAWGPAHLDRVMNTVELNKNHPSVIIWSLGNESGDGENFVECSKWVHQRDPQRPVQYERAGMGSQFANPGMADYIDLITPMYFPIGRLEGWCREEEKKPLEKQRPLIQCEYNHTMGNSSGGFAEYWRIIRRERLMQGGCIWDWRDQGIAATKPANPGAAVLNRRDADRFLAPDGSLRYFAYGGNFGDKPTDGNFCFNGIVEADLTPKPHAVEVAHQYRSILCTGADLAAARPVVRVFNETFFTTLENQPARWSLLENGAEIAGGGISIGKLAPQEAVDLTIPLPAVERKPGAEYHLNLVFTMSRDTRWAKAGHVIARDQLALDWKSAPAPAAPAASGSVALTEGKESVVMSAGGASVTIDTAKARVTSYQTGGVEQLVRPLELNFWRPPTDNDVGAKMPDKCGVWRDAASRLQVTKVECTRSEGSASARLECAIPVGGTTAVVTYGLRADGGLRVSLELHPSGKKLPPLPSVSFLGTLRNDLREWSWFGHGPEENYSDRHEGTLLGTWRGTVDDLWWPYGRPQETANRTGIRWSRFTDPGGQGLCIRPDDGHFLEIAALPFQPADLENRLHPADVPARDGVSVRIAHRNMGVGGENSWGMWPRPDHILHADKDYRFAFVIEPWK